MKRIPLAPALALLLAIGAALLGIGMKSVTDDLASGALGGFFILGIYVVPIPGVVQHFGNCL